MVDTCGGQISVAVRQTVYRDRDEPVCFAPPKRRPLLLAMGTVNLVGHRRPDPHAGSGWMRACISDRLSGQCRRNRAAQLDQGKVVVRSPRTVK